MKMPAELQICGIAVSTGLSIFFLSARVGAQPLPPPADVPEEVLRTEVITEARSPIDGQPLTAVEYAELQAYLRSPERGELRLSPKLKNLVMQLRLRKLVHSLFPFLF